MAEPGQSLSADEAAVIGRIVAGEPVDDCLDAIIGLAELGGLDGDVVIGVGDRGSGFRTVSHHVDAELLAVLDRIGVTRPLDPVSAGPTGPAPFRRDEGWDSVVRVASAGARPAALVADVVDPVGTILGRVVVLRPTTAVPSPAEEQVLRVALSLATLSLGRDALRSMLVDGAQRDDLTGLANRGRLLAAVPEVLAGADARGGLIYVDLDRFKLVNDGLGHGAGDALLRETAARLRRAVRPGDLVARVGADEFAVLCPGPVDPDSLVRVADRIADALAAPVDLDGAQVVVSASIGVVHAIGPVDPLELLRDADLAMDQAKRRGRRGIAVFEPRLRQAAHARLSTENALRKALRSDEMELHFQPVVRLADGALVGVEALLRWQQPGVGLVHPDDFVPVATDTGLILPLGRWVIERAVDAAARWPRLEVACNLSARQLADPHLVEFIAETLRSTGVPPTRLCLEITETDRIDDPEALIGQLARFGALGVRVAIDDFGTGFASLDHLRRFASADILKVDMSFIAGVTDPSSPDLAIVSAALVLAHNMGFQTIAEGVETEAQRAVLVELGCDLAQGYLFSPPVTGAEIDRLLESEPPSPSGDTLS